ncbi:MAG TPA: hypothetical protein VLH38_01860 [Patescibacteria group bacterium]|nr:hypothetical protein [Patescibacteria group bacterium]
MSQPGSVIPTVSIHPALIGPNGYRTIEIDAMNSAALMGSWGAEDSDIASTVIFASKGRAPNTLEIGGIRASVSVYSALEGSQPVIRMGEVANTLQEPAPTYDGIDGHGIEQEIEDWQTRQEEARDASSHLVEVLSHRVDNTTVGYEQLAAERAKTEKMMKVHTSFYRSGSNERSPCNGSCIEPCRSAH